MSLPPPVPNQAFCKVSALEGGNLQMPLGAFIDGNTSDITNIPSLGFLLRHSNRPDTFVFDLGVHKQWKTLAPEIKHMLDQAGALMECEQDVAESLRKGGLDPADVAYACISHIHSDHLGDPSPFTSATYLVGEGARNLPDPSSGHTMEFTNKIFRDLPQDRVRYLDPSSWPAVGPFPHALNFYGDGSLYIVDAPGHLVGHINVLARTSVDGGWIYLAGDSAHDWRIIRGEAKIARQPFCIHMDLSQAQAHIGNIKKLYEENERARVILAHDGPWYDKNKGGDAFWPGQIPSL